MRCKVCGNPGADDGEYLYNLCLAHLYAGLGLSEERHRQYIEDFQAKKKYNHDIASVKLLLLKRGLHLLAVRAT
ncbi:hypothetical protein LCGC14_1330150 [marine sediment metagenome]|uniref:Uncharacterized protein n=1 Tax=marine sediment metagenome TaxID=412755 RepID=A0A0F9L2S2_9ZZZZ